MLQRLRNKVDRSRTKAITLIEDTAERLPHMPDECFDGVNILLALFDMASPFDALREARRVLKPGGTIVVTEPRSCFDLGKLMVAGEKALREAGLSESLAHDWKQIQAVAPHVRNTIRQAQNREQPLNAEEIVAVLSTEGFESLTFRNSHVDNCATIAGTKPIRKASMVKIP
jgi:ubiquinone/menaquinone biosynthesis C-methylase UbiE